VSGTRGGKGTGIIIPNLCLWPGSCIVVDPKGENATVTARRRGDGSQYCFGLGQTVRILDPFGEVQIDASLKARYNPLDTIDPASDFAVDDAGRVAAALVVVESRSDPYWEEAARDLIKGLILHVLTDPDFESRRNLVSVWRLLNQGDWISLEMLRGAGEKDIPSGFDLLWQGMKRSAAYGGLVAGTGEQFAAMAERTRSSILGSARSSLEFISGPPMQRTLEASDFDLAALKTDPRGLSLYLTLPQRYMSTHFRWLRLMVSLAVGEMERIKGPPATGYPTLFVLDEFAGLKRMEAIEHAAAQAASFGAKFFFVVQNLTQLKEAYKDSWETFLGNSGVKLFFQIEDDFTRSYLTRQLGEQEVLRATRSGSQSQSHTEGESLSSTFGTSSSSTRGKNFGRSWGRTRGSSSGSSLTYNGPLRIFSTSESTNRGRNSSGSSSSSVGWSTSVSTSQSGSQSRSSSTSRSESVTEGWSEAVHKRSLLNPDEVGRFLARVDDRTDPAYPGILVALSPGRNPLLVRRVNYFESPKFAGLFDPHPDYPLPPTLAELAAKIAVRPPAKIEAPQSRKHRGKTWAISFAFALLVVLCLRLAGYLMTADQPTREVATRASQPKTLLMAPTSRTLSPQSSMVLTVAFSPDGRTLASGSQLAAIHLWNPKTGQLIRKMSARRYFVKMFNDTAPTSVSTIAFSSDGQLLAAKDSVTMVELWNVASGRAERTLSDHTKEVIASDYAKEVTALAFQPGTKILASASRDGAIRLWDTMSGALLRTIPDPEVILSIAFSPSERYLVTGGCSDKISFWDMSREGPPILQFAGHDKCIETLAFSPDGRLIASGSDDRTIRIWDIASGSVLHILTGHKGEVASIAFSPDGKMIATGADTTVRLWDVASGEELRRMTGHTKSVTSVAFSPDGQLLASGSDDETVRIWELFDEPGHN
jgi:type IV secretory pathway TraG/TraD family ATPase VirD4